MKLHYRWFLFSALFALVGAAAGAETITAARYAHPVDRYGHFAPGRPHEYARLEATTSTGGKLALELPQNEVSEDIVPRLVKLAADEPEEILAIVSGRDSGTPKVYRRQGAELVEIAALADFSNHVYGTPELALSAPMSIKGRMRLLVSDAARRKLRIIALEGGRLVEIGRCVLSAPITGAIKLLSPREVSVGLSSSRPVIAVGNCLK